MHNHVILTGQLAEFPELKQTANGVFVCDFRVVVQRNSQNHEEREADHISVTAWRDLAVFVSRCLKKGDFIEICGSLRTTKLESEGKMYIRTFVSATEINAAP